MKNYIEFQAREGLIRLEAIMPGVIRCVHTKESTVKDDSMLVDGTGIPASMGDFFEIEETKSGVALRSGNLIAIFNKDSEKLRWMDDETGETLLREGGHELTGQNVVRYTTGGEAPIVDRVKTVDGERNFIKNLKPVIDRKAYRAKLRFEFAEDEGIYGLGQAEEGIWNYRRQNQYLYQHNMRIPMPFFMSDKGYGLFADCCSLMTFQDDANGSYLFMDTVSQLDYYMIIGDASLSRGSRFDAIIDAYRRLTGKAALLPKWAFGYVQSKERYKTAQELADIVRRHRELGVPLDCVVQDWHTWIEDHWGEKRVDKARYGDLKERMDEIHAMHAHSMVSVWPNMNSCTADYEQFREAGFLLNDLSTYNAFSEDARKMYWQQAKCELFDGGFDSWWCDSTEPFSGPDWGGESKREPWERYSLVGNEHKQFIDPEYANLFATMHAKGIYENQRADAPEKRVLNLTRSGYSSSQRYGAVLWSGDIDAKWSTLKKQIAEGLNMAASGYPWWTLDAGAFFVLKENWQARGCNCHTDPSPKWFWQGDYEEGVADKGYQELYVRWLQMACFLPMFRSHGTDTPREIWNFGKKGEPVYDAIEKTIKLRYRLMPYIYSLAGGVWLNNGMMMRPLMFDFSGDKRAVSASNEFMFGPSLLVCPVTEPMYYDRRSKPVYSDKKWTCYLPAGCDWYDFHTGTRYAGGQDVSVDALLDSMPVFVRAGSVIPMCDEDIQYADQKPEHPLTLRVYPGADCDFDLYEDVGDGYGYESGEYTLIHIRWDDINRRIETEGKFDIQIIG